MANKNNTSISVGGNANLNNVGNSISGKDNIIQGIAQMGATEEAKKSLEELIKELEAELSKVPTSHQDDAEKISIKTKSLVNEVSAKKPDKEEVQEGGDKLLKAAKNIAGIAPTVFDIATQIVAHINSMIH